MHELSIAQAVAEVAARHAGGRRVERVELRVGHLRQVVPDALRFAFELVTRGTALDGAELALEEVPAATACRSCGACGTLAAFPARCPACGGLDVDVRGGDELRVEALELQDEGVPTPSGG